MFSYCFICIFFFFLSSVELIVIYSKATLNLFINSYLSFFWLIIYWSAYRDAKLKMANKMKPNLLRDVTSYKI